MKDFNPRVTIVIPVYNGAKYVGEAIDSALAQTYKNLEIIVANDGSNDDGATERVAKSYGDKIIYLHQEKNGGAATVLNLAIKHMTGEYFSWLSHDDLYYPNKIARQVAELAKLDDKNTIMMSDLDGINENRQKIYQTHYIDHVNEHPSRLKSSIYPVVYNKTHGCTLLIPKKCFDEVGLFDPAQRVAQDFEFFYRAFLKFPSKLVPETLVTARDTSNRMGRRAKPRAIEEYSNLYMKIIDNLSEEEVLWLAPSRLALYYDMYLFFKDAGYTIALNYIIQKIKDYLPLAINDFVGKINFRESQLVNLESTLDKIIESQAIDAKGLDVDLLIFQTMQQSTTNGLWYTKHKLESILAVYNLLLTKKMKKSASFLLSALVTQSKQSRAEIQDAISQKIIVGEGDQIEGGTETLLKSAVAKKQKPRIMFCSTHWLTGGMERVMSNLFKQLKTDYDIFLLTPFDGRIGSVDLPKEVTHLKISNSMFYVNFDGSILSHALILKIDVIVGVYNLFPGQLNLYTLCQGTRIKTIASNHEYYFYPYRNSAFASIAQQRLQAFAKVDAVIWPTNVSAAAYGLYLDNSYTIPNPNTYSVEKQTVAKHNQKNIIAVGRFGDPIKRVDKIFEAFALVLDQEPEAKLLLVGKYDVAAPVGDGPNIEDMMVRWRINENSVEFVGEVNNVDYFYKQARALVVASDNEGFGMVINEAASFGVPTVCSYFPGVEDLITNNVNGFVVEKDDTKMMAEKISQLLLDNDLHSKLSKQALAHVQQFSAPIIADQWRLLIGSLIDKKMPVDQRKKLLSKNIGYQMPAGTALDKILFNELNLVSQNHSLSDTTTKLNEIYGSISWRITKPLRLMAKTSRSLKAEGAKKTVKKIVNKVKRKMSSSH